MGLHEVTEDNISLLSTDPKLKPLNGFFESSPKTGPRCWKDSILGVVIRQYQDVEMAFKNC